MSTLELFDAINDIHDIGSLQNAGYQTRRGITGVQCKVITQKARWQIPLV